MFRTLISPMPETPTDPYLAPHPILCMRNAISSQDVIALIVVVHIQHLY